MSSENVLKILQVNLKHNFLPHFIIAVIIAFLISLLSDISSLDERYSAQTLEMLLVFIGAILLVPIFLPEQDMEIRDVTRSKKTDFSLVCAIRVMYSIMAVILITGVFLLIMKYNNCDVTWKHFVGSFSSSLFLGTVGFAAAGLSGSASSGYMAAMVYYVANVGLKNKLGVCYLFSMYGGSSFYGKYWMIFISVMCIVLTLWIIRKKSY